MIEIQGLSKVFNQRTILDNININFKSGEIVSIIGRSGSGKSTLLRCINYIEIPSAGIIKIDQETLTQKNIAHIRKKMGMVFQSFNLFSHMTVMENIIYAPVKVLHQNIEHAKKKALKLLSQVHLENCADFYPYQLSGGQKQRVAIARALAMAPQIMLFDEPTSSLDPEMVKEVLEVIAELTKSGMTMLIVTHEMAFARKVSDRILFLNQGQIIEDSSPESFFKNPKTDRAREFLAQIL